MLRLEVQYTWSTFGLGVQYKGSTLRSSVHHTRSRDVCVKFSRHPQMLKCTSHAIHWLFRVQHIGTVHSCWGVCFTRHTTAGLSVLHDTQPLGCLFTRHTTAGVFALHDTKPLGCLLYTTHNRWGVCFTQYTYHRVDPAAGEVCSK